MFCFLITIILARSLLTTSVELTFELPDNAQQCFYEELKEGMKFQFEFQVVTGGNYDVDMICDDPDGQVLFTAHKKQYDQFNGVAMMNGVYRMCFSNEFSTFSHKLVYFDFFAGEDKLMMGRSDYLTAMTMLEMELTKIHENLVSVVGYQTYHRLREAHGRKRLEDINYRIILWAAGVIVVILSIGCLQVMILKNFFADHKSTISLPFSQCSRKI